MVGAVGGCRCSYTLGTNRLTQLPAKAERGLTYHIGSHICYGGRRLRYLAQSVHLVERSSSQQLVEQTWFIRSVLGVSRSLLQINGSPVKHRYHVDLQMALTLVCNSISDKCRGRAVRSSCEVGNVRRCRDKLAWREQIKHCAADRLSAGPRHRSWTQP